MTRREWTVLVAVTVAILVFCGVWAAKASVVVGRRPGFQYTSVVNEDSCKVYVHPIAPWRDHRELHVSCTIKSGSKGPGALLRWRYHGPGMPTGFRARIEDETHGGVGDGEYVRWWLKPGTKVGLMRVPGPHEGSPKGTYIHVEEIWFLI